MVSRIASIVFYVLVGLVWVFDINWKHALFAAGIAAFVLALLHTIAIIRTLETPGPIL